MQKGSIVLVDLSPTCGHEQSGARPCLVVSDKLFNDASGFIWVVPITTKKKNISGQYELPEGIQTTGVILLSQIRSLDYKSRKVRFLEKVPADFIEDVCARLRAVL